MGFFDNRLGPKQPPAPAPTPQTVAPGAWWQPPPPPPQQAQGWTAQQTNTPQPQIPQNVHTPNPDDICPRCGEESMVDVVAESTEGMSYRGMKQRLCMNCHGPGGGSEGDYASPGVIKNLASVSRGNLSGITTHNVRTTANGHRNQISGWAAGGGFAPDGVPLNETHMKGRLLG